MLCYKTCINHFGEGSRCYSWPEFAEAGAPSPFPNPARPRTQCWRLCTCTLESVGASPSSGMDTNQRNEALLHCWGPVQTTSVFRSFLSRCRIFNAQVHLKALQLKVTGLTNRAPKSGEIKLGMRHCFCGSNLYCSPSVVSQPLR
jgi:hypothetical protein